MAILEVKLPVAIPTISLSKIDGILGESISAVSCPYGLGQQLFRGHVSSEKMNRPVIERSINWTGANLLQTNSGPGASGSSIVSVQRQATIAILVGRIGRGGSNSIVAIPISRFHKFREAIKKGTYRWYRSKNSDGTLDEVIKGDSRMLQRILKTCIERMNYTQDPKLPL